MNQIPADWYGDPAGSGQLRYWDGTAWTAHLRDPTPVVAQQPAPLNFPPPVQQTAPVQQQFQPYQPSQPQSFAPRVDPYAHAPEQPAGFAGFTYNQLSGAATMASGLTGSNDGPGIGGGITLLAIGVLGLSFSGLLFDQFSRASEPAAGSVATTGTVVELEMDSGACSPIVEFRVGTETYRAYSSVSQEPCPFNVGDSAELTYLPTSPESSARLNSDADTLGLIRIISYAIFGLMTLVGIYSLARAIQRIVQGRQIWKS